MDSLYVIKNGKKLRCGYTTGSCAAGAAKAAAMMLHTGEIPKYIGIDTPAEVTLNLKVEKPVLGEYYASCCIVKDAGDDPDVTNGMEIFAEVRRRQDAEIVIEGGEGIGRITREGFWGKVGEAAINPVPRKMIREELVKVSDHGWNVLIYAPKGEEIAKRTFNPNIGIEGGISVIGTTGIVEPMSDEAFKKTIYLEIDKIHEDGSPEILLFLGNYGERAATKLNLHTPKVKISNFVGESISYCYNKGFQKVTLFGHIGKLCKLSIGAFNTHSKVCDVRIEAFVYYLALVGAPTQLIRQVNQCKTSEEVLKLIGDNGYDHIVKRMRQGCIERIKRYVKDENFQIDVIVYSMESGILE
jgi:cobalt-precorrin-5B (C1)-methyltransferase